MKIRIVEPVSITHWANTRQVVVTCPHCGKNHVHGWPYDDSSIGHRVADCPNTDGYIIRTPVSAK